MGIWDLKIEHLSPKIGGLCAKMGIWNLKIEHLRPKIGGLGATMGIWAPKLGVWVQKWGFGT